MAPQMKKIDADDLENVGRRRSSLQEMTQARQDTSALTQDILDVVEAHFPGALESADILSKVVKTVEKRGLDDENTLYAQSICPDEINHEVGDITNLFIEQMGEVFHLGGLGGIPFTGKTGFGAYSHHVPEDGHCFILMAPHIGLDSALNLGKYDREGQTNAGAACGAAIGALCHCDANKPMPDLTKTEDDYQMAYIIHKVNEAKAQILAAPDDRAKQSLLAAHMHQVAKTMLDNIVTLDFGGPKSTLTILTGIQINMPDPMEDYFQPLSFYALDKTLGKSDLFEETFGMVSPMKDIYCMPISKPVVTPAAAPDVRKKPVRKSSSRNIMRRVASMETQATEMSESSRSVNSLSSVLTYEENGVMMIEC